ncbi:hypothetical protein [Thalassovita mediterranea]|jgi:hypothetical protein|uniref:Uncharacterized protein n=1 Tax=Thalassovita mediterranea TaxID=340021 RepID=A0A0P1H7U9_9RHOB|nr:hypothetical protein [Thalassovita mediterranea]CUH86040.1 hypothetical protein TM5383_03283 [Thalassovita mediterranea]SIS34527.1 hypothetical protein SAMN05421685_1123 [Thalassovita mediterranea]
MKRQLVLYLDNCVFSELLKPGAIAMRRNFSALPHRIAFSDVHITEMRNNHEEYSTLLNELDAVFVRNPGQVHERYDPISALDTAVPEERFANYFEFSPAYEAFDEMLAPMHHLMGGRREKSMDQVALETERAITNSLMNPLGFEPDGNSGEVSNALKSGTESLASIDVSEVWQTIDTQVSAAREGDPMREMDPGEKVHHVLSKLSETERRGFIEEFPEKFAQLRVLKTGELTGFAFALFGMGLTKRKGKFTGPRQTQKFAAQFRDAQHIEEASRCDCFITFDQDASELAASTFAYAGFPTQTLLLMNQ